jgi:hypothetical protein
MGGVDMSAITGDYDDRLVLLKRLAAELAAEKDRHVPDKKETLAAFLALPEEKQEEILASLPDRERQILALRFGLQGWRRHTLEVVGWAFGLSPSRIWQIENRAVRKLRWALDLMAQGGSEKVGPWPERRCRECGAVVEGRPRQARYCSVRCRNRAAEKRRREREQWEPPLITHCPWCGAKLRQPLLEPPPPFCDGDPEWHRQWSSPPDE